MNAVIGQRTGTKIDVRPVIVFLILAATAVPIEWRWPPDVALERFALDWVDVAENVLGYLPLGVAFASLGGRRVIWAAALVSLGAEATQLFLQHRTPSLIDVAANVAGAALGVWLGERLKVPTWIKVDRLHSVLALALAGSLLLHAALNSGSVPSERGATLPGALEGYWKLDGRSYGSVSATSGSRLLGRPLGAPVATGDEGHGGLHLNGVSSAIDLGRPSALRLKGSMTASAWIRAKSFPPDDAAIISSHNGVGYQLDTTVDTGPRTVGFKLGNSCGQLMARYGATSLETGRWYHVTGVYDAHRRTIDVYLDGRLDNGRLVGAVTSTQKSSRGNVYIGQRSDSREYGFAGDIADVRIYSFALSPVEVAADRDNIRHGLAEHELRANALPGTLDLPPCTIATDREDARFPALAGAVGVFACVGFVGLLGMKYVPLWPMTSLLAGIALMEAGPTSLPIALSWQIPVLAVLGGLSVVLGTSTLTRK